VSHRPPAVRHINDGTIKKFSIVHYFGEWVIPGEYIREAYFSLTDVSETSDWQNPSE
jgi:hypothetical protein